MIKLLLFMNYAYSLYIVYLPITFYVLLYLFKVYYLTNDYYINIVYILLPLKIKLEELLYFTFLICKYILWAVSIFRYSSPIFTPILIFPQNHCNFLIRTFSTLSVFFVSDRVSSEFNTDARQMSEQSLDTFSSNYTKIIMWLTGFHFSLRPPSRFYGVGLHDHDNLTRAFITICAPCLQT